jgi:hypothetical protein
LVELEAMQEGLLSDFLEAIYSRLNSWLTVDDPAKIAYLARLSDFKADAESVDLFSLNYDLCIERAFAESSHSLVNGFTASGWTPSAFQPSDRRVGAGPTGTGLPAPDKPSPPHESRELQAAPAIASLPTTLQNKTPGKNSAASPHRPKQK